MGYFDNAVLNRGGPKFLIQLVIARDYTLRTGVREVAIWYDYDQSIAFQPGFAFIVGFQFKDHRDFCGHAQCELGAVGEVLRECVGDALWVRGGGFGGAQEDLYGELLCCC
jgi:hypothetical protein